MYVSHFFLDVQEIVRSVFFLMGGRISDSCTLEETLMATNVAIAHWTLEHFKNRFGEHTSHSFIVFRLGNIPSILCAIFAGSSGW